MLEGIPKREYPKRFYRCFREFLEVLAGKTSLKLYLAQNYPSLYKPKFKNGERVKWKGYEFRVPKVYRYSSDLVLILGCEMYSTPECHVKQDDIVFDVGAHLGSSPIMRLKEAPEKFMHLNLTLMSLRY